MKIKKETILRTILLFTALLNSVLIMTGKNPLPFSDDEIYVGLSAFFAVWATLEGWWKNNSFTADALKADEYLKELKEKGGQKF